MRELTSYCIFGGLVALAVTVVLAQSGNELPENPHAFMDEKGTCGSCHTYWEEELEPHMFSVLIHDKCKVCHTELGRSHPININPRYSDLDIPSTDPLPLAYVEELGDDVISCGTCHNPHGEWLSTVPAYKNQKQGFLLSVGEEDVVYYKTYYLRVSDPVDGFLPLCKTCHHDY